MSRTGQTLENRPGEPTGARRHGPFAVRSLLALAAVFFSFSSGAGATASTTGDSPGLSESVPEALESIVRQRLAESRTPAAAVVVRQDGRPIWSRGFGTVADESPVTPDTVFGIGSISKGVTGVIVASLVHEGILDLDTPVERLLPTLREPGTPESHRNITLRHLVYQTSGLDARGERLFVDEPAIVRARSVWRRPLVRPPGEAFEYLNTNYLILGLAVEATTGADIAEFARERVFAHLGPAYLGSRAPAHQLWFGWPVHHREPPREYPASGGLSASAGQLADLVEALGRGGSVGDRQIFDPAVVALAITPGVAIDDEQGYAMGWYRRPVAGVPTLSHGGSTPGYSAYALHQEDEERTVVVLTNSWGAIWGSQTPVWIAADLTRRLENETVPTRSGAVRNYLWLDLIVLISLALTVRSAWKMRAKPSQLADLPRRRDRWKRVLPAVVWNFGTVAALVWLVPLWARFSLRSFLAVPSDVSLLLIFGIASGMAFGVAELVILWSASRRRATGRPSPTHHPGPG